VARELDAIVAARSKPLMIVSDNVHKDELQGFDLAAATAHSYESLTGLPRMNNFWIERDTHLRWAMNFSAVTLGKKQYATADPCLKESHAGQLGRCPCDTIRYSSRNACGGATARSEETSGAGVRQIPNAALALWLD